MAADGSVPFTNSDRERLKCLECGLSQYDISDLFSHIASSHALYRPFECLSCRATGLATDAPPFRWTFSTRAAIEYHFSLKHVGLSLIDNMQFVPDRQLELRTWQLCDRAIQVLTCVSNSNDGAASASMTPTQQSCASSAAANGYQYATALNVTHNSDSPDEVRGALQGPVEHYAFVDDSPTVLAQQNTSMGGGSSRKRRKSNHNAPVHVDESSRDGDREDADGDRADADDIEVLENIPPNSLTRASLVPELDLHCGIDVHQAWLSSINAQIDRGYKITRPVAMHRLRGRKQRKQRLCDLTTFALDYCKSKGMEPPPIGLYTQSALSPGMSNASDFSSSLADRGVKRAAEK